MVLRRRLLTVWLFWLFWTCILFSAWIMLAVSSTNETGEPVNHVVIYFLVVAIIIINSIKMQYLGVKRVRLNCCAADDLVPKLHEEFTKWHFLQPSFWSGRTVNTPMGMLYGGVPFLNLIFVHSDVLPLLKPEELHALVCHEIAHIKNRGMIAEYTLSILAWTCILYGSIGTLRYATLILHTGSLLAIAGSALLVTLLWYANYFFITLPMNRRLEYAADETGAQIHKCPDDLIHALKAIYYSPLLVHRSIPEWRSTHPPLTKRLEALKKLKSRLG